MPIEELLRENTDLLDEDTIREQEIPLGEVVRECLYELMLQNVIFIMPRAKWRPYDDNVR